MLMGITEMGIGASSFVAGGDDCDAELAAAAAPLVEAPVPPGVCHKSQCNIIARFEHVQSNRIILFSDS